MSHDFDIIDDLSPRHKNTIFNPYGYFYTSLESLGCRVLLTSAFSYWPVDPSVGYSHLKIQFRYRMHRGNKNRFVADKRSYNKVIREWDRPIQGDSMECLISARDSPDIPVTIPGFNQDSEAVKRLMPHVCREATRLENTWFYGVTSGGEEIVKRARFFPVQRAEVKGAWRWTLYQQYIYEPFEPGTLEQAKAFCFPEGSQ